MISHRLTSIQEAIHLVRWEEILKALGKRAVKGDNRWNRSGLTTKDLASSRGMSVNTYLYTKKIANLHPEVQDILNETEFANNKMDMVRLTKETDEVQLETANLLQLVSVQDLSEPLQLARCKVLPFDWDQEKKDLEERLGKPFSSQVVWRFFSTQQVVRWFRTMLKPEIVHRDWAQQNFQIYQQHPDHSAYFIDYYSKEGDTIADVMSGRGTNLLVGAAMGRRVVGYDMNPKNLNKVRSVALEHTNIKSEDLVLHHSDGCDLVEYADQENIWDLVSFDPPYFGTTEKYIDDERCLSNMKDQDQFYGRIETCLTNLKRLIKPSNWEKKNSTLLSSSVVPTGMENGLHEMATEVEIIAKRLGFVLHDKLINALTSHWAMFTTSRCIDYRYSIKNHETNLV